MGSMSLVHWGIALPVVMLVFGTRKLATIGADLGSAVKGFKDGVKGDEEHSSSRQAALPHLADRATIAVESKDKTKS
jgi:sec-independent protein translocase protein TatA